MLTDTQIAGGLKQFGNDVVQTATPAVNYGQSVGTVTSNGSFAPTPTGTKQSYSVVTPEQAIADYTNKGNYANSQAQGVQTQSQNNQQKSAEAAVVDSQQKSEQSKTDALNKATDAVTGNNDQKDTSTGDPYIDALNKFQADAEQHYNDAQQKIANIQNGVVPLDSNQQALYDSLQQQFNNLREQQQRNNIAYEGGVEMLGVRSGINRYAGAEQGMRIKQAVDEGVQKIAEIDSKSIMALAKLKQGFIDDNVKAVQSSYDDYTKLVKSKTDTIKEIHGAIADEAKAAVEQQKMQMEEQKLSISMQQKQQDFNVKNNITQPFYMQGGYLFNSIDGTPISDPETARKLGVADDLSNVTTVDSTDHSASYKEWKDYQLTGGKLGFNDYMTADANRKRSVTNVYAGDFNNKEMQTVQNILKAHPNAYGAAADAIDEAFGKGTATKYDSLLKATYLLPGRARELSEDPRISKMTDNQKKDLRNKFIQDNNYVNPDEAGKAFDDIVGKAKVGSGRNS